MKINKCLLMLLAMGILILAVSSVNAADNAVDIGGNTFFIPGNAQNIQTDANTCNFTIDNISAAILKIGPNDFKNYMSSDQSKRYEVVEVTIEGYNLYRYEDCNAGEKGFFTIIPKSDASYIMRLYIQDDHSASIDTTSSERMKFIGIFKGFLVKNAPTRNLEPLNSVVV